MGFLPAAVLGQRRQRHTRLDPAAVDGGAAQGITGAATGYRRQ